MTRPCDQSLDQVVERDKSCTEVLHPVDPRSSKHTRFAQSFQVPKRDRHVQSQPSIESPADSQCSREVQLRPPQHEGSRGVDNRLRADSSRQDLSGNVESSPGLDWMVREPFPEVRQREPPESDPLHSTEDRASGTHRGRDSTACRTEDEPHEAQDESQSGLPQASDACGDSNSRDGGGKMLSSSFCRKPRWMPKAWHSQRSPSRTVWIRWKLF